mgnify:CR=1 FL=1
MKIIVQLSLALLTFLVFSACANTRYGIQQDARRAGEKTQEIGQILTTP